VLFVAMFAFLVASLTSANVIYPDDDKVN
jgi:hypothetical protein